MPPSTGANSKVSVGDCEHMKEKERVVVLLSGGPDSSTLAYWVKDQGYEVHTLTWRYGQTARKEVECAISIAEKLGIPLKVIDLSSLQETLTGTPSSTDETVPLTSKFRLILFSTAVAYAITVGARRVFYGAQGSDPTSYHNWRRKFQKSFETTARLATHQDILVEAPFAETPKSAILKLGSRLGVPFGLTWSCYLNGPKHCGTCMSCVSRKEAFKEARIPDPTEYNE